MAERWLAIRGWPGYQVSDLGRVRSLPRTLKDGRKIGGGFLAFDIGKNGYPRVGLSRRGHQRNKYVHQLVMRAFAGQCPPGMEVRHLNGNRADPRLVNLCYGTPEENTQDRALHGTNSRGLTAELVREMRTRYATDSRETYDSLSLAYGVSRQTVRMVLLRRTWTHVDGVPAGPRPPRAFTKPHAKLTDAKVLEIRSRAAAGETARSLAVSHGVTASTIGQIVRGETWIHVGGLKDRSEKRNRIRKQDRNDRLRNAGTSGTCDLP